MNDLTYNKEGMYLLSGLDGQRSILVQGYHSSEHNGQFGFGFNNYDGGEFLPLADLPEEVQYEEVYMLTRGNLQQIQQRAAAQAYAAACHITGGDCDPRNALMSEAMAYLVNNRIS